MHLVKPSFFFFVHCFASGGGEQLLGLMNEDFSNPETTPQGRESAPVADALLGNTIQSFGRVPNEASLPPKQYWPSNQPQQQPMTMMVMQPQQQPQQLGQLNQFGMGQQQLGSSLTAAPFPQPQQALTTMVPMHEARQMQSQNQQVVAYPQQYVLTQFPGAPSAVPADTFHAGMNQVQVQSIQNPPTFTFASQPGMVPAQQMTYEQALGRHQQELLFQGNAPMMQPTLNTAPLPPQMQMQTMVPGHLNMSIQPGQLGSSMNKATSTLVEARSMFDDKKETKKRKKNIEGKPKRSLTPYNVFFKITRAKILKELQAAKDNEDGVEAGDTSLDKNETTSLETLRSRRKSPHNLIKFDEMAKMISERWKNVDPETMEDCKRRAKQDGERYRRERAEFLEKQNSALQATQERLESSVAPEERERYLANMGDMQGTAKKAKRSEA